MAENFEVTDTQADKLNKSLQEGDGITARHLLEEVGSCGWPSLVQKTREASGWRPYTITSSSESADGSESLQIFRLARSNPAVVIPLAKATDKTCEKK